MISSQYRFRVFSAALVLASAILLLTACETPSDNTIEGARQCLDQATAIAISSPTQAAQNAQNCDTMISSSTLVGTSSGAGIEFGAILVEQGKIAQIASMAQTMGQPTTGNIAGLNSAIAVMVFNNNVNSGETGSAAATRLQSAGNVLGGGAQTIGALVYMSTYLNSILAISGNPANALTNLQNIASGGTPQQQQTVANTALSMEQSACTGQTGASTNSSSPCYIMQHAIGSATTPAQICQALATYAAAAN